ncbi:MAG: hypothetical protein L6Q97_02740 [Thermoanaerobaculia bacterium]|nr:hypothetical protein [Thermoanaerobaculia bacterium]
MRSVVESTLQSIRLGEPVVFKNMAMVPLLDGPDTPFSYLTMKSALAKGFVEITEVSEGGSVPNLKVINRGDQPVLLLDGEEVKGAKQNRIINTSILLAAKSETVIPVSCTEQGRWNYNSRSFSESGHFMPARSRSSKSERVYANLLSRKSYDAEQGAVWNEVASYHRSLNTFSRSGAMSDAYEQRETDLSGYLNAFPLQPGQKGMVILINGQPAGADFLSRPDAYSDVHEKLIKSFAVEAMIRPVQEVAADNLPIEAYTFLRSLTEATESGFEPVGLGEDLRYDSPRSGGAALVYEHTVVHLNVYPKAWILERTPEQGQETVSAPLSDWIRRRF